jgi:hypothetical protein
MFLHATTVFEKSIFAYGSFEKYLGTPALNNGSQSAKTHHSVRVLRRSRDRVRADALKRVSMV